jgi:hypothetical protein
MDVLDFDALDRPSLAFESLAIYDLVELLGVREYEDLLAPHWTVPDRAYPRERFDPTRFARSVHWALVALPGGAPGDLFDDADRSRATTLIVPQQLIDGSADRAQPDVPAAPPTRAGLIERLQRALGGWHTQLLRLLRRRPC